MFSAPRTREDAEGSTASGAPNEFASVVARFRTYCTVNATGSPPDDLGHRAEARSRVVEAIEITR